MSQPPYPEQPANPQLPQNQMPHQQANSWMPQDGAPPAYLQQQYQPAWQMPQTSQNPHDFKKSNKTIFLILGSIAALIIALIIAGVSFVNSLASNEAKKIENMKTIADRLIPGEDWIETSSMDPKVDPTCIPSNISCHRLQRTWEMPYPVSASEIEAMLNIDFNGKSSWRGCSLGEENGLEIELCVPESDIPQVTLRIQD